jgi:uncharacterized membrane protein YfcA
MIGIEPLVFNSLWIAATVLVIVTIGAIIQAGLGMGFGLTVAPVLALVDPALVPAPALYLSGWAGVEQFWLACFMAPAAVLGTLLGNRLKGRVNTNYRPYLLSVAGVASVLLIVQGLM